MIESEKDFIRTITSITEDNLSKEEFGPEELAKKAGISYSSLHRKLKSSLNLSGSQFIRNIRLEKSKELLLQNKLTVSEIAYRVGFGSPTYFIRCFHEYFGVPPGEYKLKPSEEDNTAPVKAGKRKRKTKLVLTGILASVILVAALILLLKPVFEQTNTDSRTEKSLAILPVKYIGEADEQYMAEGTMQEIINHLMQIRDLRVAPRTSVEQYRNDGKTIRKIGSEQNVSYILETSFQKIENKVLISCFLYRTNDEKLLWNKKYEKEWADIMNVQIEMARDLANELKAVISPEEKRRMEKTPTLDLTAYDFYQRGLQELNRYDDLFNREDKVEEAMKSLALAKSKFLKALEVDSTFARAYLGFAEVYNAQYYWKTFFAENCIDSIRILAEKAISLDDGLGEAYFLKGYYYYVKGESQIAIKEYRKAIELNANLWRAYYNLGELYLFQMDDAILAIENMDQAILHHPEPFLSWILRRKALAFQWAGLIDEANHELQKALELDNDSSSYYLYLSLSYNYTGNFKSAIEVLEKALRINPDNQDINEYLGYNLLLTKEYTKALVHFEKMVESLKQRGTLRTNNMHRVGFIYLQNGKKEKARQFFEEQKKYNEGIVQLKRSYYQNKSVYYDIAAILAFEGKKEEALKNLKIFASKPKMPSWGLMLLKNDPLLDNIRNEPEFQAIFRDAETKYLSEQERVKHWMKAKGMI